MTMLTRRAFARELCAVAAGTALVPRLANAFGMPTDARPHVNFPTEPRQRMAVAAWPFRAYINSPTNTDRDPKILEWISRISPHTS